MEKERTIETYQNLLMQISEEHWEARDTADRLQKALTRACIYLTRGYIDNSEKTDFTSMQWDEFLLKEVDDAETNY